MLEKEILNKNCQKQNFEDVANSIRLDKEDTQRSNLNIKYLSVPLVINYPDSFVFIDYS